MTDYLSRILERKQAEILRRKRHGAEASVPLEGTGASRRLRAEAALRRGSGDGLRVIAEVKRRSPSAGQIRPWKRGDVPHIAGRYEAAGAAAVSVLCDGPGFGGSPLDLRRAAKQIQIPVLFKEFVLDPIQIALARRVGASMVLLLVRALSQSELEDLVQACIAQDLAPVVEAADGAELERALHTKAAIVGVNVRNLRTFQVDKASAGVLVDRIPEDRIAVFMSGIHDAAAFGRVQQGRADAVLIGEALMRGNDPAESLRALRGGTEA